MPTPTQRAYAHKLTDLSKRLSSLEEATLRAIIGDLQALRKEIAAAVVSVGDEIDEYRMRQLQTAIDRMIADTGDKLQVTIAAGLNGAGSLGEAGVAELLALVAPGAIIPTAAQLNIAGAFSAELVRAITEDIRQGINTQLRLAMLGQRTPFQVMKAITAVLGVNAYDGVWGLRRRPDVVKGVAARAEAIARTELTRMYNLANHGTMQQLPEQYKAAKGWVATGDNRTRPSHRKAHGQVVPVGGKFDVGGVAMAHPGDPDAPAKETVNCRCRMVTIFPGFEDIFSL